ncbi:MAG TPA: hypothetical protein VGH85_15150, partial [Mycobacteriales bacterium]
MQEPISTAASPAIAEALAALRHERAHEWSKAADPSAEHMHGLFQYPAMMVPQMQREILAVLCSEVHEPARLWDPFVGSGTTLDCAMDLGLDFTGRDINPLAVLICRVKTGPYHLNAFEASANRVCTRAVLDRGRKIEILFPNWRKWFRHDVAVA